MINGRDLIILKPFDWVRHVLDIKLQMPWPWPSIAPKVLLSSLFTVFFGDEVMSFQDVVNSARHAHHVEYFFDIKTDRLRASKWKLFFIFCNAFYDSFWRYIPKFLRG